MSNRERMPTDPDVSIRDGSAETADDERATAEDPADVPVPFDVALETPIVDALDQQREVILDAEDGESIP
jgi:hypothetical protein